MTGKTFRIQVYFTIVWLLVASVITLWGGLTYTSYADASRTVIPVYIAVAAAWLTFCLQRRVAYLNALRQLWEKLVDTVQDALRYTRQRNPTKEELGRITCRFSCRIDEVRGVFRNVAERYSKPTVGAKNFVRNVKNARSIDKLPDLLRDFPDDATARGLFPFESLKQMLGVIQKLGYGRRATVARGKIAGQTIERLWQILRAELLKEFDRDYPAFPDTPYHRPTRLARLGSRLWGAMNFKRAGKV